MTNNIDLLLQFKTQEYLAAPDKYVYSFSIPEKGKVRNIITYNDARDYGKALRSFHERIVDAFSFNFCDRNEHSFAYHKNVRTLDALQDHLKSNYFIKLDIHHFFESITKERFFEIHGKRFNKKWKAILPYVFYRESLSIGFVSSPLISDFFMSNFDEAIEEYIKNHAELHYSRYSDDILLSSEGDNEESLDHLFEFVKEQLALLHLEINEKKTKRAHLEQEKHNAISFLGLNISKQNAVENKITISKRYILFLLFLIEKNNRYNGKCRELLAEIKSRVGYLKANSPISFERFQKKHTNIYGYPYSFDQTELKSRNASSRANEIEGYSDLSKDFEIKLHSSVKVKGVYIVRDGVELVKYRGSEKVVTLPKIINIIGKSAFAFSRVQKVIMHQGIQAIGESSFEASSIEEIELPKSCVSIGNKAFARTSKLLEINIPANLKRIPQSCFESSNVRHVHFADNAKLTTIERDAFRSSNIEEITLPDTVTDLGEHCFESCAYLKQVNLGKGIQEIKDNTFASCVRLESFEIKDNVLLLRSDVFAGSYNLKRIFIGKNLISLSRSTFDKDHLIPQIDIDPENSVYYSRNGKDIIEKETKTLIYASKGCELNEEIECIGESAFAGSLIKEADLRHVKTIRSNAFRNCYYLKQVHFGEKLVNMGSGVFAGCISLESIAIPSSLKIIPSSSFSGCRHLKEVKLHDDITRICEKAFYEDENLVEIVLPTNLVRVDHKAFANCYKIKEIHISSSVKRISHSAFAGLSKNLERITVDEKNVNYSDGPSNNCLIERQSETLILGCRNSVVPENVKHINDYAFAYCKGLKEIVLPESVTSIGKRAFVGCPDLEAVSCPNVFTIGEQAFFNSNKLSRCALPESLVEIGKEAFSKTSLEEIVIPNSIFSIGVDAFSCNDALRSVVFPSSSFVFQSSWFEKCGNIERIEVGENNPNYPSYPGSNALIKKDILGKTSVVFACKNTIIPEGVNALAWNGFKDIKGFKKFSIPKGCELILPNAFYNCFELKEIHFPSDLTAIPDRAFMGCVNLESINLPDTLELIGGEAFSYCINLKQVRLGEKVHRVGAGAFSHCTSLEEAFFDIHPENTSKFLFPSEMFLGCKKLKEIRLASSFDAIEIKYGAFKDCVELEHLDFDRNIVSFEKSCFEGCESLSLCFGDKIEAIGSRVFKGMNSITHVHIPASTISIDAGAFLGCPVETITVDPNNPNYYGNNVIVEKKKQVLVQGCKNSIISEEVIEIGEYAFAGAKGLKTIEIPANVKTINTSAFQDCEDLEEVHFNEGLQSINQEAFVKCKSLKEVNLPSTVRLINKDAFSFCENLKSIHLTTSSFPLINSSAFDHCINLEMLELKGDVNFLLKDGLVDSRSHLKQISIGSLRYHKTMNGLCADDILIFGTSYEKLDPSIKAIGPHAFSNIKGPSVLTIPEGIECIDHHAFDGCEDIKEIVLPASLREIYWDSFANCNDIEKFAIHPDNPYFEVLGNAICNKQIGEVIICCNKSKLVEGMVSLGLCCMNYASKMEEIDIPSTLWLVSTDPLWSLTNLKSIRVSKDHPTLDDRNGSNVIVNTDLNQLVFANKYSVIDDSITRYGGHCFVSDDSITKVYIPKQITFLGLFAFRQYQNLESVEVDPQNKVFHHDEKHQRILANSNGNQIHANPKYRDEEADIVRHRLSSSSFRPISRCSTFDLYEIPVSAELVDLEPTDFFF